MSLEKIYPRYPFLEYGIKILNKNFLIWHTFCYIIIAANPRLCHTIIIILTRKLRVSSR